MQASTQPADPVRLPVAQPFTTVVQRAEAAITGAGLAIFARIDHAQAAADAGLTMPPTLVIIYGNARGGTPVMLACPDAALDLPLRVLLRAAPDGSTLVVFHPIVSQLTAAGVPSEIAARLGPAQRLLVDTFA